MEHLVDILSFERIHPARRVLKSFLINPAANFLPASMLRALLRLTKSELAAANWKDPGGWRSMVISYDGKPRQIADKILVSSGTMPMALRNRRRLGAAVLAGLINEVPHEPVQVLGLAAGPGHIITDAILQANKNVQATLIDISSDAFDYGRQLAQRSGLSQKMRFIQGDVRNVSDILAGQPCDLVKMLGICEYLDDQLIVDIAQAVGKVMPKGSAIVFNTISPAHGTDRFFRRVFGLNMIYRDRAQLEALFARGGFGNFTATAEPLGVYHIVVGRKA